MRIVFDTHVLISAFLTTTGPSQYVFTTALKRHTVILSEYVLEELRRKLIEKLGIPKEKVHQTIDFLKKRAIILNITKHSRIKFSDRKDIPLLALVTASKAHYFVTGDKKLLELKKHGSTLFLTPREAMEILESK